MIGEEEPAPQRTRLAHAIWAALAFSACLFLVLTKQTGHPPPIVLVPFVVVAWAIGHGLIWGAQRLAARGRSALPGLPAANRPWPIVLRLVLVATGIAAIVGVLQLIGAVLQRTWYPYHDARLWWLTLAAWMAHAACFGGLLLRRRWSRWLSAMLPIGWALMLGLQIAGQFANAAVIDTTGVIIIGGLIVLLVLFATYLLRSREIKSFLVR